MWLINTETYKLEEFLSEKDRPKYSILSHRWRDGEEITLQDMLSMGVNQRKNGIAKIIRCCDLARSQRIPYAWVDTCCINKESSAELTEAINSMFRWYAEAEVCYAFLSDAKAWDLQSFGNSNWFTRGWTLQELVAPSKVVFYDEAWNPIGTKVDLGRAISTITGIDLDLLEGARLLEHFSVAERMSWAANRQTTRPEDRAYSLLGIFDVNMPLLYGEGGERAFLRLQEEIIKYSYDHSIFAWPMSAEQGNHSLLARKPEAFAEARGIGIVAVRKGQSPYSVTNRGVSITLSLTPWYMDTYLALINCTKTSMSGGRRMGIFLRRLHEDDQYARIALGEESLIPDTVVTLREAGLGLALARDVAVNVRQAKFSPTTQMGLLGGKVYGFRIARELLEKNAKGENRYTMPRHAGLTWNESDRTLTMMPGFKSWNMGTIDISQQGRKIHLIRLAFDFDFNPVCFLAQSSAIGEETRFFNKAGQLNVGESSARQWTEKEMDELKSFNARSINDIWGWNSIRIDATGVNVASENSHRKGLWQLRGDRVEGLDVVLSGLDEKGARLTIKRNFTPEGLLIWDFSLTNLSGKSWRKGRGIFS
jgi:hypothetical protein